MKKVVLVLIGLALLAGATFQCQRKSEAVETKTRIIVLNPTAGYLEAIVGLAEKKLIDIPDLELTAVFYARVEDRYSDCEKYVSEKNVGFVKLHKVDCELNKGNLFERNSCSEHFHGLFSSSDGALFLGGADIPPVVYQQKTNLLTGIFTPDRSFFELSLLHHLIGGRQDDTTTPFLKEKPDYVVYGFCLGMQTMNVAAGGTMFQDIPSDVYGVRFVEDVLAMEGDNIHSGYWLKLEPHDTLMPKNFHRIRITENGYIDKNFGPSPNEHPKVCSYHHQAVNQLAGNYAVSARSMDGKVIEAVHHRTYKNVFGVQFHPEFLALYEQGGQKYKLTPSDTTMVSENEILNKDGSLQFHKNYWKYFSKLFR